MSRSMEAFPPCMHKGAMSDIDGYCKTVQRIQSVNPILIQAVNGASTCELFQQFQVIARDAESISHKGPAWAP